jgi:hypothetical protein
LSWKTPITLAVLLVVLLGAAFYGWRTIVSPAQDDDEDPATSNQARCDETETFERGQVIHSKDIVVNVYNAGTISGLAGETLDALASRGFEPGKADNAPAGVSAENVTVIAADKRSPAARLVASQFKGDVRVVKGEDIAPGVDVVVGNDFKKVDQKAKKTYKVKEKVTTCVSAGDTANALAR